MTLKEGYGFIRCTDRDARMFFHYSELLDLDREIRLQQEVEFTVVQVGLQYDFVCHCIARVFAVAGCVNCKFDRVSRKSF